MAIKLCVNGRNGVSIRGVHCIGSVEGGRGLFCVAFEVVLSPGESLWDITAVSGDLPAQIDLMLERQKLI